MPDTSAQRPQISRVSLDEKKPPKGGENNRLTSRTRRHLEKTLTRFGSALREHFKL